jgi:AcrR family transcriptional regulator
VSAPSGSRTPDTRAPDTRAPEPRAPDTRSVDARARILAAASTVFAQRGFNGGSLNDVAIGAEMTCAGVLHHYPSKQAVLLALLEQRDRDLQLLLPPEPRPSLVEFVDRIGEVFAEILRHRELVELAHSLTAEASHGDHPAREWVLARHAALRANLASAVSVSQERGEVASGVDPVIVATAILGAIEGIENQWLVAPDEVRAAEALDVVCRAILAGYAPTAPAT